MDIKEVIKKLYDKKEFFTVIEFATKFNLVPSNAKDILDFGVQQGIFYETGDDQYDIHETAYLKSKEIKNIQEFLDEYFKGRKIIEGIEGSEPENFFERKRDGTRGAFIPKSLGDFIKERFTFKTIKGNERKIYFYHQGYYKENGISLIREFATSLLKSFFKDYYVSEVLNYIRNSTYIDAEEINHEWINLKNGLLNPITKEHKEHSPEIFTLQQLPISYEPEADCPIWKEKLKEKCDERWKYNVTQEMFGYCLLKDQRFEKAFLLYGDPRTMKSTTLYILTQLLGEKNVTAMSLQYLTEDRHGPAFLYGNPANVCADLSSKELKSTAMFMKVVGQDSITAGKKFEQEITFLPFTKLIFSCNVIPATRNKNMAFYRRWVILEYNIQTAEKEVDPLMREKLLDELPGILNWALEGLSKILKENKISYPLTDDEVKDLYEKGSDSIQSFIYNEIDCEDDEGSLKKREVYKNYLEYCKENKLNVENQIIFGRRFFAVTGCGTKRIGTIPAYSGVSFKNQKKGVKQVKIENEDVYDEEKLL